ncbi:hypothetical protein [Parasphaerochaeta coccoides]|uniref:hypothetical protein n=1 Tax=Parasphaerochaeta coccoides TaxID=273376 RepID=UPI00059B5508|nr:hypothetical protein [Parasphaerochaeta coccoides]
MADKTQYNSGWSLPKSFTENVLTKNDLVNRFRKHRQHRTFLAGISPDDPAALDQYANAEKQLTQRGFYVENPFRTIRASIDQVKKCSQVAVLTDRPAMVEGLPVERIAQATGIPMHFLSDLLPRKIDFSPVLAKTSAKDSPVKTPCRSR